MAGVASPDVIFMHNSLRPTDKQIHARGVKDGNILFGTEEQFNNSCANDGKLVISDLTDSWGGEPGLNSTPAAPYRMKAISTWHPAIDTPETCGDDQRLLRALLRHQGSDAGAWRSTARARASWTS